MTPDALFLPLNLLSVAAWLLLIIWPGRAWVTDWVAGRLVPGLFAVAYVAILVTSFAGSEGSFTTLAGVAALFRNPWLLLAGWLHYLAFDLLIGCWEARDAQSRGVPQLLLIPCLGLTLMFGPAGWLAYLAVRQAGRRHSGTR